MYFTVNHLPTEQLSSKEHRTSKSESVPQTVHVYLAYTQHRTFLYKLVYMKIFDIKVYDQKKILT